MSRREISPGLIGSVLLHGAVAAALLISWRFSKDLKIGAVVPVNIVANAPSTDLKPALEAPQTQSAQAEAPTPAPPQPAPPAPQPTPQPPQPQPKAAPAPPKPAPTPPKPAPTPAPAKPQPQPKPEKSLDLDALAASVSKLAKPSGGKPSAAPKGPNRAETAPQARPALGSGLAASALSGLAQDIQRRWNPNCDVEGGRDVQVRVTFTIGASGQVAGQARAQIRSAANPVSQAAADRAVRAVYAAAPFRNLPQDLYGQTVNVNFNAREACS